MRKIKFRAWDKKEKRWINDFIITRDGLIQYLLPEGAELKYQGVNGDNIELIQYTGLEDKNGKEIYEGDVVKIPDNYNDYGANAGEIYEVYFAFGGFRLKPKYEKTAKGFWLEDESTFEVISNIYENTELLNN